MALLTAEALHFRHRDARDADRRLGFARLIELERLDDCGNEFHEILAVVTQPVCVTCICLAPCFRLTPETLSNGASPDGVPPVRGAVTATSMPCLWQTPAGACGTRLCAFSCPDGQFRLGTLARYQDRC